MADGVGHGGLVHHFPGSELPLGDRAVHEERGVGPVVGPELGVQRSEAHRHFGVLDVLVLQHGDPVLIAGEVLVLDRGLDLLHVEHGGDALELAGAHDPVAVGSDVDTVRRLAAGQEVHESGDFLGIEDLDPADHRALAFRRRLLREPPVDHGDVVAVLLGRGDFELPRRLFGVVRGEEHVAVGGLLARVAEVVVERRHDDLPAEAHLTRLRVDLDAGDHALVVGRVLVDARHRALGNGNREAGGHDRVLAVRCDEGRGVVSGDVGDRADDLLGLEVAQVDAGEAPVHLVDEEPAAVVVAVRLGERGMVNIAPGEVAQHLLRLVVETVAGRGIGRVHGNRGQMPHGRNAVDVDLAGMAARGEHVVLVEVAGGHVGLHGRDGHVGRGASAGSLGSLGSAGGARHGEYRQGEDAETGHLRCTCRTHVVFLTF